MSTLSASELFRTLRDEAKSDQEKLKAAQSAWYDANMSFPKLREFLLDWCFGRLLKAKDEQSPDALISSASCWSFLDELLAEVSSESLAAILTKIPTLPIFNAFLSRHSALATDEKTCNPARSVLDHILPLAAARATADAVSGSIFLVYQVMVQQTTGCTAWTDLLTCACQHLPVSLALASSAVHKKLLQQFLDQQLPLLLDIISSSASSLSSTLLEAIQNPMVSIAFDASQLHKILSHPSKQDVDFMAGWRKTSEHHRAVALPYIFHTYVKSLQGYTPSYVASTASTSRSVTDAQSTLLIRSAAFAFLQDAGSDKDLFAASSTPSLLNTIHVEHLYAPTPGHSEPWKAILNKLLSSACADPSSTKIVGLCLLVQIEPTLADHRIQEILLSIDPKQPEATRLFDLLRAYYTRTRRLPDYLDALVQAFPQALPPVEKTPLATALAPSVPPAQSLPLCSRLLERALQTTLSATTASQPSKKKQKRSSTSSAKQDLLATNAGIDAACLVLEHVEVPFVDQQALAQQVCAAFQTLYAQRDSVSNTATKMQLSNALLAWMLEHQSSMAGRLAPLEDSLVAAAETSVEVLASEESSLQAKYHAFLLAFALSAVEQEKGLNTALQWVFDLVSQTEPTRIQQSPEIAISSKEALALECWAALLSFIPSLSESNRLEKLGELLASLFKTSSKDIEGLSIASITLEYLRSPVFSRSANLKGHFLSKLAKEVQSHPKLSRSLLSLPYAELSSHLRKRALDACNNPKGVPEYDLIAFLAAHLQAGGSLPEVPDKIAQKVQQAVRPKEDAFAQVLPAATKEAICQALELLSLKIQEDGSHCSLVGLYLHQLGSVLSQAPSSCNRQVSETFASTLRILEAFIEDHPQAHPPNSEAVKNVCTFVATFTASQSRLVDHSDVAAIFSLFSYLLRSSESKAADATPDKTSQIFISITSAVSTLVRHRKDIVVAVFPALMDVLSRLIVLLRPLANESKHLPFWATAPSTTDNARLFGRLLTNITAKTVQQKSLASKRVVSSLQGPMSKHAGYFLLAYLRACTASQAPLSPATRAELTPGLNEIIACMNKYERDALMNGLLSVRDEAERVLLRTMWKDYDRARYKGQA